MKKQKKKTQKVNPPITAQANSPSRSFSQKTDIKQVFVEILFNAVLLTIGLVLPAAFLANPLFHLNLLPFTPAYSQLVFAAFSMIFVAALLYLFGVSAGGKWFSVFFKLMVFLFLYGVFLPFFLNAIVGGLIIQFIIGKIFGLDLLKLSTAVNVVLTLASLVYGIYLSFQNETSGAGGNQSFSGAGLSAVGTLVDVLSSDSSDSDSGSDSGGDGGD